MAALSIAIVACAIWGRNRGICITDESFCLLQCLDPERYARSTTSWHFIANKLPRLSVHTISNFRLWHVVLQIVGALVLSIAFRKFAQTRYAFSNVDFLVISFCTLLIANFLDFSCYPLALSYNSLLNFLTCCSAGCFLYAVPKSGKSLKVDVIALLLCGFFNGLCFFVKPPSFAAILLLLSIATFASRELRTALFLVAAQFVGILFAFITYFLFFENPISWWMCISEASAAMQRGGRSIVTVLFDTYVGFAPAIFQLVLDFGLLGISAFGISYLLKRRNVLPNRLQTNGTLFFAILAVAFTIEIYVGGYFRPSARSVGVYYGIAIVLSALLLGFGKGAGKVEYSSVEKRQDFSFMFFLACLPFAEGLGTGNNLFGHTIIHMAPWFIFVILLSLELTNRLQSLAPYFLTISFLSIVGSMQFFFGFLNTPYGLALSMREQKMRTVLPGIRGQKLSFGEKHFLEHVYSLLVNNGFQDGDTVLAFYNLPGIVLAAKANSVGASAYFPDPAQESFILMALNSLKVREPRLFVLESWEISPAVKAMLAKKGYDFPSKFKLAGTASNPYGDPSMNRRDLAKRFLNCRVNVYVYSP